MPDDGDAPSGRRQLTLGADAARLAGIRVEPARLAEVSARTRLFGRVEYDESRERVITAWISGRIDRLHVDTTGELVRAGQALASVYSPELVAAQAEFIQAVRARERAERLQHCSVAALHEPVPATVSNCCRKSCACSAWAGGRSTPWPAAASPRTM